VISFGPIRAGIMSGLMHGTSGESPAHERRPRGVIQPVDRLCRDEHPDIRSHEEKARILAESAAPGVNVSEVARRNGVSRGLLTVWRRKARLSSRDEPQFVQPTILTSSAIESGAD
jgi:Transposase